MFLLDTNHCGELLNGHQAIIDKIVQLGNTPVVTSVVSVGEMIYGAYKSETSEFNIPLVESFLNDINIFDVDRKVADIYGKLKSDLFDLLGAKNSQKRKKQKFKSFGIPENDLWIASIAKRWGYVVVTTDIKDFSRIRQVLDIQFESWV